MSRLDWFMILQPYTWYYVSALVGVTAIKSSLSFHGTRLTASRLLSFHTLLGLAELLTCIESSAVAELNLPGSSHSLSVSQFSVSLIRLVMEPGATFFPWCEIAATENTKNMRQASDCSAKLHLGPWVPRPRYPG